MVKCFFGHAFASQIIIEDEASLHTQNSLPPTMIVNCKVL